MEGTALQAAFIYQKHALNQKTCIISSDLKGFIYYVDNNFCKLSGYLKEDLIGQNEKILKSNKQSEAYFPSIFKAMEKGSVWHDEVKYHTKNGHTLWLDRTIVPFLDSEGKLETYTSVHTDITEQKTLANSLSSQKLAMDTHSIIAETDIKGSIIYVNDKFCNLSGYSREELIGQNHRILNSNNKPKSYWSDMYKVMLEGNVWQDEVKNRAKDGKYYWVDTTIVPRMGVDGKPQSYISIRTDITEEKKLANLLVEQKFAMDQHVIIATTDADGSITYANDKFMEISGYSQDELIGQNHRVINSGNQPKSYWKAMYDSVSLGNVWKDQVKNIAKNGSYYWVETSIVPFMGTGEKPDSYISIRTDITNQKKVEEVLSNHRFAMDQHSIIAITDINGLITYVNDKFCEISGYSEKELIGKNHRILNSNNQPKSYWQEMYKVLKNKAIWQDEIKNKTKDGKYYWVDTTIAPFFDLNGKVDSYISIRTDITKYKKVQEELEIHKQELERIVLKRTNELEEANTKLKILTEIDPLTNLPNRRRLKHDYDIELSRAKRFDRKMALFFLDLDNFKATNDKYGHKVGDSLLQLVSEKVLQLLRKNEFIYRIGGDEFCILIPEFKDREKLQIIAQRIIKEISGIDLLGSIKINVGCSIGIAISSEDGETLSDLLTSADNAMYLSKKLGKNIYTFC